MQMSPERFGSGMGPRAVDARQVAAARSAMPVDSDVTDLADVFHLLGDPNRVRILIALSGGRLAVRDVAAVVELSESAVSHALRLLRAHRVVSVERVGRVAYYALGDEHVRDLLRLALEHIGHSVLLHPTQPAGAAADDCERGHEPGAGR
jgi:ArsR family transcriptional regulator, lead/cadmium/zinc/bismuth-responsive transcriptional repressor